MPEELTPRFEPLEHTADAGVVAYGRTLPEVFEQAACGLYALIVDAESVQERERWEVSAAAPDLPGLLAGWLAELLFLTDTQGAVFRSFQVVSVQDGRVRGQARGERLDPGRHQLGVGVKAVTHHRLGVSPVPGGFRATVLFDI